MFPAVGPVSETSPAQAWVKDYDLSGVTPLSLLLVHSCFPWRLCGRVPVCVCVCVGRGSDTGAEGHLLRFLEAVSHCLSASWPSLAGTLAWLVVRIIAAPWLLAVTYHQQATLALGPGLTAGVRG